ncbi:MAG: MscL family protein [Nanobdellota archaeon]
MVKVKKSAVKKKPRKIKTWDEFRAFLKEYKVVSVAVAFIMGAAVNDVVKVFVNNLFMPLLDPLIPGGTWETASVSIGNISLGWGLFVSSLIKFALLALVVFLVVKKLLDRERKNPM